MNLAQQESNLPDLPDFCPLGKEYKVLAQQESNLPDLPDFCPQGKEHKIFAQQENSTRFDDPAPGHPRREIIYKIYKISRSRRSEISRGGRYHAYRPYPLRHPDSGHSGWQ